MECRQTKRGDFAEATPLSLSGTENRGYELAFADCSPAPIGMHILIRLPCGRSAYSAVYVTEAVANPDRLSSLSEGPAYSAV